MNNAVRTRAVLQQCRNFVARHPMESSATVLVIVSVAIGCIWAGGLFAPHTAETPELTEDQVASSVTDTFIPEAAPGIDGSSPSNDVFTPLPADTIPQDQATTPDPQTTAPTPDPQTTAPTPDPQTTAPTPDPQTTAPTPDPQTTAPTPDPQTTAPTPSTNTPRTFTHPGVLLGNTQLDGVKAKIAAKAEPWWSAYKTVSASSKASTRYTPHPRAYVKCGHSNTINLGCTAEMDDAVAAYTQAVLWRYTGKKAYAQTSIKILNAWSRVLVDHPFDTKVYSNGVLQAAWAGQVFTRAAEIIRYSNAGWSNSDIARFEKMLNKAMLPRVIQGWKGGSANWSFSMADAMVQIGVFTNNIAVYQRGIKLWRNLVPSNIYLSQYGSLPAFPPETKQFTAGRLAAYWRTNRYVDGLQAETCRDLSHMTMGLEAMVQTAETARLQGDDLYGEQQQRIIAGFEKNAGFTSATLSGTTPAGWPCPRKPSLAGVGYSMGWEIAYSHYAGRQKVSMPKTKALLDRLRKRPTLAALHMNWERLTSYNK